MTPQGGMHTMKLRKLSALFLSAAVLTVSAVPMASAAAADFDINLQEEYINDPGDVETVSATFGENGSVTLTLLEGSTTGSGRFMMWTNVDDPFVNREQIVAKMIYPAK